MKKLLLVLVTLLLMTALVGCDKETISDNWVDMEFKLGNKKYSLPGPFKNFSKNGWLLEESAELEPADYTTDMYKVWNKDFYDQGRDLYAFILMDFENYADKAQDIKDCDVYWVAFSTIYDNEKINNGYEIELAKGIKWGSTEEEIVAAYGPVEEGNKEVYEGGYTVLVYVNTTKNIYSRIVLYLLDDGGLYSVILSKYPE